MKISLVTITYNDPQGFNRTLRSVSSQTEAPYQHIIVDSSQPDLAVPPDPRYTLTHTPPGNIYHAMNHGIAAATGQIIGLLHGGDTFTSNDILASVRRFFEQHPDVHFIYGDVHFRSLRNGRITRYYSGAPASPQAILRGFMPPHPSVYIRAEALKKAGPYDTSYHLAADFKLLVKLFHTPGLKWQYLPLDMVEMAPGGLSTKLRSRLYQAWIDRRRALRENGFNVHMHKLFFNSMLGIKSYIHLPKSRFDNKKHKAKQ